MTSAAGVTSPASPAIPAAPPVERRRPWQQPPRWLWPLMVVLQVLSAAALTSYTYFFVDDWLFIAEARRVPLGLTYLRDSLFEHFSPISRILDKLLIGGSSGSFALAHSLQLIMYAGAIVAFAFVVRTLLGNRWWAFVLTVLFGQSLFLMRLLNWWTATANILPATILGLIAFGGYLRWQRGGSRRWLAVTLAAFFGSLLDYEIAMLFPVYILLVRLLVLEDDLSPRTWLAVLRRERLMWAGFAVLEGGALINYFAFYHLSLPMPSLVQIARFVGIGVFGAFIPALFGIKNPQTGLGREPAVIAICLLAAAALLAYVLYTRPRVWRCVLAFAVIAVITMLPVGIARITTWGVHAGKELYYQQSLQFMFLILVALALRTQRRRSCPAWLRTAAARVRAAPVAAGALCAALVAGYGVLYVMSVDAMGKAAWEPHRSRAYVRTLRASIRAFSQRTGSEPVLFDAQVPVDISGNGAFPYNHYDNFFPMLDSHVRFNTVTNPMYVIDTTGRVVPAVFVAEARGVLAQAIVHKRHRPVALASPRTASYACMRREIRGAVLRVPLDRSLRLGQTTFGGIPPAAKLFVRTPKASTISVQIVGRRRRVPSGDFTPIFPRGASGQYVPLDFAADASAIDIGLPAGACVDALALGSFSVTTR